MLSKPNTDLSYKGVMFSLHFLIKIVLGFLIFWYRKIWKFVDYFGYYKNYFGSTVIGELPTSESFNLKSLLLTVIALCTQCTLILVHHMFLDQ